VSLRTPNEAYLKSRRALVVVSGLLALSVLAGIVPAETDSALTFFSFKLESPENIPLIFFVISVYTLWQMWSAWLVQSDEVRFSTINRVDVVLSFAISLGAWIVFLWPFIWGLVQSVRLPDKIIEALPIVLAFISVVMTVLSSIGLDRLSRLVKRNIRVREASAADELNALLEQGEWELVFNPSKKNRGVKPISFSPDGAVGAGRNDNEHFWRVKEGTLEIINNDGRIYSRFRYDNASDQLLHTNDEDTISIRSQIIRRRGEAAAKNKGQSALSRERSG
jgi:hypothetical protein